ncbi:MAG TPA: CDP-alcohol phosphatidyltransferase family protein [Candidatus Binataceae bacterium]|nr:CDP-alcohol phosphatidyltransferase family protein [Candidatus Binataceae bacterium]
MLNCERAGVKRFVIEVAPGQRDEIQSSLGRFKNGANITLVDSADDALKQDGLGPETRALALSGNLVLAKSHLARIIADSDANPSSVVRTSTTDYDRGGEIAVGPIGEILKGSGLGNDIRRDSSTLLPFALNGRLEDRDEAELRLARELRNETAAKDAILARLIDRKLSWQISYRLAQTKITPNQVTIANTILGVGTAWLFSIPGYWTRLLASILFLFSVTLDGVDGELARLQMSESKFGGQLDIFTDNVVHVALFIGLFLGCYRASMSRAYLYLIPLVLGGFAMCAFATWRAFRIRGDQAAKWLDAVDRWSGRDFAYILVVLALIDRLEWFAWGTAFGTYVFAFALMWLTARRVSPAGLDGKGSQE